MIAVLLIFWDTFWRALILGLIFGGLLFSSMLFIDFVSIIITAPIAMVLFNRQIREFWEEFPLKKVLWGVWGHIETYACALQIIHKRVQTLTADTDLTPDTGLIDTLPIDNPFLPIVFRASIRKGKGMDDELKMLITNFFKTKLTYKKLEEFKNIYPQKYTDPEFADFYAHTSFLPRIIPFHVLSYARVDVDHACSLLDYILSQKTINPDEIKNVLLNQPYITKATYRFINEMVWYVYKVHIGPCLTPYMLSNAFEKIREKYEKELEGVFTRVEMIRLQFDFDTLCEQLLVRKDIHPLLRITDTELKDIMCTKILEQIQATRNEIMDNMLNDEAQFLYNKWFDENLGECEINVLEEEPQ